MSTDKYQVHQKTRLAKIVLTETNGTVHNFKTNEEYMKSDFRKKQIRLKNQRNDEERRKASRDSKD